MNLFVMLNDYLLHVLAFSSSENYRFVKSHLSIITNFFITNNLPVCSSSIYQFIINQHNNNISNTTINKRLRVFKQMFKYYNIQNNDLFSFKKLSETKKRFNCLSAEQLSILSNYIYSSNQLSLRNKLIIKLFLDTGCRLNELLHIKISNINLDHNFILLDKTKTNVERIVLFTEDTKINFLIPYISSCSKYLFTIKKSAIRSLFERVRIKLNFDKFHPHMLRHTYATILINNEVDLEFIRLTLGHTNLSTTQRYLHYSLNKLELTYKNNFYY